MSSRRLATSARAARSQAGRSMGSISSRTIPGRHRIDVEALHIASDTVRLDQRGAAAHERIRDPDPPKVVRPEEQVLQPALAEFRKDQAAEQGPRTAGEPFVDADDRAVALLDLLLPERHPGDQGNVEALLDAHRRPSPSGPAGQSPGPGGLSADGSPSSCIGAASARVSIPGVPSAVNAAAAPWRTAALRLPGLAPYRIKHSRSILLDMNGILVDAPGFRISASRLP